jgi:rare lipoprotein A
LRFVCPSHGGIPFDYAGLSAVGRMSRYYSVGALLGMLSLLAWSPFAHAKRQHDQAIEASSGADQSASRWMGETGVASYYGRAHNGNRTAAGTRFNSNALTAAHPWLPFGTEVRVTLAATGRSVIVVITDRLYSSRRIVDLSLAAAQSLGMIRQGVAVVSLSPT